MIQFKRGSTKNWRTLKKPLAAGQPGYDKEKNKIKVGDGESSWSALPYASGLSAEEIFNSEEKAKIRHTKDPEDTTIITYGTSGPDKNTVGQLYLQYYETEPETDYVVSYGRDGYWMYQKWRSGIAKCWATFSINANIATAFENSALYHNDKTIESKKYPITFTSTPTEVATLLSSGGIAWLAGKTLNTTSKTATYDIISSDVLKSNKCNINIQVEGYWR